MAPNSNPFTPNNKAFEPNNKPLEPEDKVVKDESDLSALADDFSRPKAATSSSQSEAPKASTLKVESKTINEIDLDDLDETTLLKYPIEARQLDDMPSMHVKPSHNDIVLRWCYCGNDPNSQVSRTNMAKNKYKGYEFATVEDVQGGEDALGDSFVIDGGQIHYMDTVLMKINKIRLMGHYKAGLLKSLRRVDQANSEASAMAKATLQQESDYRKGMHNHPEATVEFYNPQASNK